MTDLELWAVIVGFFVPVVLSVINQPTWSSRRKSTVAFIFAVFVGAITAWLQGDLNGRSVVSAILLVLVLSITTYKGFWKPTGVAGAIEVKTSHGGSSVDNQE